MPTSWVATACTGGRDLPESPGYRGAPAFRLARLTAIPTRPPARPHPPGCDCPMHPALPGRFASVAHGPPLWITSSTGSRSGYRGRYGRLVEYRDAELSDVSYTSLARRIRPPPLFLVSELHDRAGGRGLNVSSERDQMPADTWL
jgi:hypothetical protein